MARPGADKRGSERDDVLTRCHAALERLLQERPTAVAVVSTDGAVEETYRSFRTSLS